MSQSRTPLHLALAPLVVAAVRPSCPNGAVIRTAAELADQWHAELMIVGAVEMFVADWGDLPYTEAAILESCEATMFASCAEILNGQLVRWSVHVASGSLAMAIRNLNERRPVVGLVLGSGHTAGRIARTRRRIVGSFHSRLRGLNTVVVDGV